MNTSFSIPGIEVQSLHSDVLQRDLQLFIKLPWTYEHSEQVYPVLYCTDANRSFQLYSTTSLIFETPGPPTSEILIVGIGYRLDSDRLKALVQWAVWRTLDLTPIHRAEINHWWEDRLSPLLGGETVKVHTGGSQDFLTCIRHEIIPYIEMRYRVSSADRGLAGYSDGGLFTLYALFRAPGLFQRYFAGSPSMWEQLFLEEVDYASTHTDLPGKLLITAGMNELELLENLNIFLNHLRSRKYPRLELLTRFFEDEGHSSAYPASVSRALSTLYHEGWRST
jgi:hypothetical protein